MKKKGLLFAFVFLVVIGFITMRQLNAKVFRLGVPNDFSVPIYKELFSALDKKGLKVGKNLKIVPIDLNDTHSKQARERIRREIAQKTDLFFVSCDYLGVIYQLEIKTPLLFISLSSPQSKPPLNMKANTTGFFRGSINKVFLQIASLFPNQDKRLGLVFFNSLPSQKMALKYKEINKKLGIDLRIKSYDGKKDIKRVMQELKAENVNAVILFMSVIRKSDVPELIVWQNRLKLPVVTQLRAQIEQGLFGGPAVDFNIITTSLADYASKLLQGRKPSQLPIKYFSPKLVLNLPVVSRLGIDIPEEISTEAEIIGVATKTKITQGKPMAPIAGNYVIGMPKNVSKSSSNSVFKALRAKGYVEGKNLRIVTFDLKGDEKKNDNSAVVTSIPEGIDLIFTTGNVLPLFYRIQKLTTPICFIAIQEIAAVIPEKKRHLFTGIIRTSLFSTVQTVQQMMFGAKKMALMGHYGSHIKDSTQEYRRIALAYNMNINFYFFRDRSEIGSLMKKIQADNDFILLFPANLSAQDIDEIVKWQNQLSFPVFGQLKRNINRGLLGGVVIDFRNVAPKTAEYIDKILQGEKPSQLPIYHFSEKLVINLRTASILRRNFPAAITTNAEIIR